jgi:hypothetical protein
MDTLYCNVSPTRRVGVCTVAAHIIANAYADTDEPAVQDVFDQSPEGKTAHKNGSSVFERHAELVCVD